MGRRSFLFIKMRSWSSCLKLPVVILVLVLILAWNNNLLPGRQPQKDEVRQSKERPIDELARKNREIEEAILKQSGHVVAEECSPTTEYCYTITDEVRRIHRKLIVQRMMHLNKLPGYIFTAVNLKTPERLTWKESTIRNWPVDKLIVDSEYCQMQIAVGFITEALHFISGDTQQVLMIGLGGGVSSSFLSILPEMDIKVETTVVELDPFIVKLAEKYFDHDHIPGRTNVVVNDGVKFLEDTVKNQTKYRSILLDACYSMDETTTGLLCPIREFLTDKTIQSIYDSLEEGGVVSVNTISSENAVYHEKEALALFEKVFPSCYLAPYQAARNMLVCSKKSHWTWLEQRQRFKKNLEDVISKFDFQDLGYLRRY